MKFLMMLLLHVSQSAYILFALLSRSLGFQLRSESVHVPFFYLFVILASSQQSFPPSSSSSWSWTLVFPNSNQSTRNDINLLLLSVLANSEHGRVMWIWRTDEVPPPRPAPSSPPLWEGGSWRGKVARADQGADASSSINSVTSIVYRQQVHTLRNKRNCQRSRHITSRSGRCWCVMVDCWGSNVKIAFFLLLLGRSDGRTYRVCL